MAKKTTSTRNTEPSNSEPKKQPSVAMPAKKGVAKLATTVRKTIKDVLTPKGAPAKRTPTATAEGTKAEPKAKGATRARKAVNLSNNSIAAGGYTQDDVALRAYFLAEQRLLSGTPGSPEQDWIEAERQLATEYKRPLAHS